MWSQIKEWRKVDCCVVQEARDIDLVVVTPQRVEAATRIYTIHCSIEGGAKCLFVVFGQMSSAVPFKLKEEPPACHVCNRRSIRIADDGPALPAKAPANAIPPNR